MGFYHEKIGILMPKAKENIFKDINFHSFGNTMTETLSGAIE